MSRAESVETRPCAHPGGGNLTHDLCTPMDESTFVTPGETDSAVHAPRRVVTPFVNVWETPFPHPCSVRRWPCGCCAG